MKNLNRVLGLVVILLCCVVFAFSDAVVCLAKFLIRRTSTRHLSLSVDDFTSSSHDC